MSLKQLVRKLREVKVFFWICHDGDSEGLAVLGTTVGTRGGYYKKGG